MLRKLVAPLALLSFAACGPNPGAPPVKVMALVPDAQGAYKPTEVGLRTVLDPVSLHGSAATLRGGAKVVIDENEINTIAQAKGGLTEEDLRGIILKNAGLPVHVNYVDQQGVLWPSDFHSWNMVSTYWNFERAFEYFQSTNRVPIEKLQGADVFYFPDYSQNGDPKTGVDNALFQPLLQGFMILPFDQAQQVPYSMNPGIVAHEYSHQVFARLVYGGSVIPAPLAAWPQSLDGDRALNLLRSMDEGFADYHAVQASCTASGCNTRFLEASFDTAFTDSRDMGKDPKCLSAEVVNAYFNHPNATFMAESGHYLFGTVLAAAMYQAGEVTHQRGAMQRALISSYSDADSNNPGWAQLISKDIDNPEAFDHSAMLTVLVNHVKDQELKRELCGQLLDRLGMTREIELPACPVNSEQGRAFVCKVAAP